MPKRWHISPHDRTLVAALERSARIPGIVASLLVARGVTDAATASTFLGGTMSDLRDPDLLPGVPAAAEKILAAARAGRKIVVYGDYDADGMCATAILMGCLEAIDATASWYVPDRVDEGYGLNARAVQTLAADGARLVVTVDCGIASVAEARQARELGLELIITDHHSFADTLPEADVLVDPSIARGLDYYTGIVLESFLDDLPTLGSICSGGRYDNLAGLYTKQPLPGVGASLGIDRLLAGLEELGRLATAETPAELFLVQFSARHLPDYLRLAAALRGRGVAVEFFPEPKRLGQQLKLAAQRGFPLALILGEDEFAKGTAQLKKLASEESGTIDWHGDTAVLVDAVLSALRALGRR